jgi:four helix bundle protein
LRAATAAAPNYAEARGAESARDFVHKLGIALKELNEAEVWLDIVLRKEMGEQEYARCAREECSALCRILAASVRTAGAKLSQIHSVCFGRKNRRARRTGLFVYLSQSTVVDRQLSIVVCPETRPNTGRDVAADGSWHRC